MFKEISHFKGLCTTNAYTEPSCYMYVLFDHEIFLVFCASLYPKPGKWWISLLQGGGLAIFLKQECLFPSGYAQLTLFLFVLTAVKDIFWQLSVNLSPFLLFIFSTGCWLRLCCQGYSWFQWCRLDRNLSAGKMISSVLISGRICNRAYVQSIILNCIYCKWI